MNYVVCSGYHAQSKYAGERFFPIWLKNTLRHSNPKEIYIISTGGEEVPPGDCKRPQWIIGDNLGHAAYGSMSQHLCGGHQQFLLSCLLAYGQKADLVFKEQDCLMFGDCVGRMYSYGKPAVIGQTNRGGRANGLWEDSLVLVKNEKLLEVVQVLLSFKESDKAMEVERKKERSGLFHQMDFGVGRSRPIPYDSTQPFYFQQPAAAELNECEKRGLL